MQVERGPVMAEARVGASHIIGFLTMLLMVGVSKQTDYSKGSLYSASYYVCYKHIKVIRFQTFDSTISQ